MSEVFDGVKHLLDSKDERRFTQINRPSVYGFAVFNRVKRRFTPVEGVEGVYSMKRLAGDAVGG